MTTNAATPGAVTPALPKSQPVVDTSNTLPPAHGQWTLMWLGFRDHRAAYFSLWVLGLLALACVVGPFLLPWTATEPDYGILAATAPSASHPLGTDAIGRDVLARLLSAGRISLLIGLMVALIAAAIGAAVGIAAGYFGGKVDTRLTAVVNVLMTIPPLPLLIAVSSVVSAPGSPAGEAFKAVPGEWRIIIIMSLLGWMPISRIIRSQVLSLTNQEFVEAARALGGGHLRVTTVHILPNTISVLAVFTTLAVSQAILGESSLSFLGLGVPPPTATWGNMLLEARDVFTATNYWWQTWPPALCISTPIARKRAISAPMSCGLNVLGSFQTAILP
jgi:peptide/nickel transport system permease protein